MFPVLEHVMDLVVHLEEDLHIGEIMSGYRRVIPIKGGYFSGKKLNGVIIPGGADWNLSKPDGSTEYWARYTLKTEEGTLISVLNQGKSYFKTVEAWEKSQKSEPFDFEEDVYCRTTPTFEVASEHYAWLMKSIFLGTLSPHPEGVKLQFYLVR